MSVEAGRETNAIKVNQQPELIEIKDQKRGHGEGGAGAAFTGARWSGKTQRWWRFVCRTDISSWLQPEGQSTI